MLANAIQSRLARNANLRLLKATRADMANGKYFTASQKLDAVISSLELADAADSFTVTPTAESDDVAVAHV